MRLIAACIATLALMLPVSPPAQSWLFLSPVIPPLPGPTRRAPDAPTAVIGEPATAIAPTSTPVAVPATVPTMVRTTAPTHSPAATVAPKRTLDAALWRRWERVQEGTR